MITSRSKTRARGTPTGDRGTSALARLAATALAALATRSLVAAGALSPDPFELVITKQQVVVKAAPADQSVTTKKVVVARPKVVIANANQNPMIARLIQQGKPLVHAELLFARGVCKLDKPTLIKIHADSGKVLEDVANTLVQDQVQARRAGDRQDDAPGMLRRTLAVMFKKHLTADQYRIYQTESARRGELERKAGVRFLVDCLDRELHLSDDQRTTITESLSEHWDGGWTLYLDYLVHGNSYYPATIDRYVSPTLNEAQRVIWKTTTKVHFGLTFGPYSAPGRDDVIPLLLGIETKDEAAQRELVRKRQAAELEAREKTRAETRKKAAEAQKDAKN